MSTTIEPSLFLDAPLLFKISPCQNRFTELCEPGTVVLHYGGWTFLELFWNEVTAPFMGQEQWYNPRHNPWITDFYPTGYYALRLPISGIKSGSREDQRKLLLPDEEVAPNILIVSAAIAIHLVTGQDPLPNVVVCAKDTFSPSHPALSLPQS